MLGHRECDGTCRQGEGDCDRDEDCLPGLFIQFCVIENQQRVSKILQIFSRQAVQASHV